MTCWMNYILLLLIYFKQIYPLKITIKTNTLPLNFSNQNVLEYIFVDLMKKKDYDTVLRILEVKTFDTVPAYVDSCPWLNKKDYKNVIEYFYSTNQRNKLNLLLSPDCILRMKKRIFHDGVMIYSLKDLPRSVLANESSAFNFRTRTMQYSYCRIVSDALANQYTDINWDNFASSPNFPVQNDKILLSEIFAVCDFPKKLQKKLFYYLNPSMLYETHFDEDITWLTKYVLPISNTGSYLPDIRYDSKHIEPKVMSEWNEILFRTVSTLAFYFEASEKWRRQVISNGQMSHILALNSAKRMALNSLNQLHESVDILLQKNPVFKPLLNVLNILNNLHIIFIDTSKYISTYEVNRVYRSISYIFHNYSPKSIQGDWMYNLFHLFWKRKCSNLKREDIGISLNIFFSKTPTIFCINKVNNAYVEEMFVFDNPRVIPFDEYIPDNRLIEIYKGIPRVFTGTKFEKIKFDFRFEIFLREGRRKLSMYNIADTDDFASFLSIPLIRNGQSLMLLQKRKLLEVFNSTILALHHEFRIGTLTSFGVFLKVENDLTRPVDIRTCIKQFFDLILMIQDFRIIVDGSFSSTDSRPVIIITPMISKDIANILGQSMVVASLLNMDIPFVVDFRQFKCILDENEFDETLLPVIIPFCSRSDYLKSLNLNRNFGFISIEDRITKYLASFYSWSHLFYQRDYSKEKLIKESFKNVNFQMNFGIKSHFYLSKFTFEEILWILFKIKTV